MATLHARAFSTAVERTYIRYNHKTESPAMRPILLSIALSLTCIVAGAQEKQDGNTITSWNDFVTKSIRALLTVPGSRIAEHKDVTIFSSGTDWQFYADPAHGKYTVVVLYMPRFVPAPTVSFGYPGQPAVLDDNEFKKVEDGGYGMKILRVNTGQHTLARVHLVSNGRGESSSVTMLIVEY